MIICGRYGRDVERERKIHVLDEWIVERAKEREVGGEGREGEEGGREGEEGGREEEEEEREGEGKREGTC